MKKILLLLSGFLLVGCTQNVSILDMATHEAIQSYENRNVNGESDPIISSYINENAEKEISATITSFLNSFQQLDLEKMEACTKKDSEAARFVENYSLILEETKQALDSSENSSEVEKQIEKTLNTLKELMQLAAEKTVESFEINQIDLDERKAQAAVSITGISGNAKNTERLEESIQSVLKKEGVNPVTVEESYQNAKKLLEENQLKTGTIQAQFTLIQQKSAWKVCGRESPS